MNSPQRRRAGRHDGRPPRVNHRLFGFVDFKMKTVASLRLSPVRLYPWNVSACWRQSQSSGNCRVRFGKSALILDFLNRVVWGKGTERERRAEPFQVSTKSTDSVGSQQNPPCHSPAGDTQPLASHLCWNIIIICISLLINLVVYNKVQKY